MRRAFALILACLAAVAPVWAEDARLRSLETGDAGRGWNAVGRLDLGGRGFCTGALIAPDLVLTAGHCLYDKETGARIEPAQIEFLAGWRNGRAEAYRGARQAVAHPDFIYSGTDRLDRVTHDLALIELDQPIRLPSVQPFATGAAPAPGAAVGVISYARDRAEAPSLQESCAVLGQRPGMLVLSCDVDFGASGAPVFTLQDGEMRVVSVVSAKAELEGRKVALGAGLEAGLADLRALIAGGGAGLPPVRRMGAGGAKFLSPGAAP